MRYPFLKLEETVTKNNIRKMACKARDLNLEFRPHFKTHQSGKIGEWFRDVGVNAITVSSLSMAEYFASQGWLDITVAFPVSILDLRRIDKLTSQIDLHILVNDLEAVEFFNNNLTNNLSTYIEIDPNYGRSGIPFSNLEMIEVLVKEIDSSKTLNLTGFYAHAGHSYKCKGINEIKELSKPLIDQFSMIKAKYGTKLCWGDTPSCSVLNQFGDVDQISPGNFVFYDWMQVLIGSCTPNDIALKMNCSVVSKYQERQEILIHGGAVHFSKEFILNDDNSRNYGQVINSDESSDWSNYLKSVSQEHGIISCNPSFFNKLNIGDVVEVYPIHSCLTANLMQGYSTTKGEFIKHFTSGTPYNA